MMIHILNRKHNSHIAYFRCCSLPLHNMCRHTEKVGAPPECAEILDFIMTQYPESLKHASNCGQLALHIASEEGVACSMLKKMVRLYPLSLLTRDKEYALPIQLAYSCTSDLPDEEEWLQEAIPILTPASCSPMLFCCNQRCSLDLVKYIQEKLDPDCCTRFYPLVTNGGVPVEALPLHMACLSGNPELSVLQWLVEHNPRAVSFKIQGLFYPLQCFFQSKRLPASEINVEAVEYMVNQYPAVIKKRDYKGRLPIQVAATAGAPLSVIYHLLRMAPDDMANIFQHPTSSSSEVGAAAAVKKMKKKSAMVRGAAFEKKPVAAMDQKPASSIIDNGNMSVK
jgi:Ankyrin repeat